MNQITIECKKITKHFGQGETYVPTLKGVDLIAHENETIMIMGPSGSGKTTLISIIGGILNQDSGECLVLNESINSLPEEEKTKFRGKHIGFMFQHFTLVPTLNSVENAAIPLLLQGYSRNDALRESSKLLLSMGLDSQRYRTPNDLSGGEQQRVAIARACIHRPKIILCDEPTSFLDHIQGQKIMQLLTDMRKENNSTLIVVTHDPRILGFADQILEIEDGFIRTTSANDSFIKLSRQLMGINPEDKHKQKNEENKKTDGSDETEKK
jgi:putative ABC transport system ATP-binding protein